MILRTFTADASHQADGRNNHSNGNGRNKSDAAHFSETTIVYKNGMQEVLE